MFVKLLIEQAELGAAQFKANPKAPYFEAVSTGDWGSAKWTRVLRHGLKGENSPDRQAVQLVQHRASSLGLWAAGRRRAWKGMCCQLKKGRALLGAKTTEKSRVQMVER